MKLSTSVGLYGRSEEGAPAREGPGVRGIDMMWLAELYSFDAVSIFGYSVRITSPGWLAPSVD